MFDCEYMTPFGCPARDFAKELMTMAIFEGDQKYKELKDICKEQCCKDCKEICGYKCGKCK